MRVRIGGVVQGVGFRPFIHNLAERLQLKGWVRNTPQGVLVEAEGRREDLDAFLLRIEPEKPPRAFIQSLEVSFLNPRGFARFEIRASDLRGEKTVQVLPDIAACSQCLAEVFDPKNRRYLYPFTNCTHCGPRYSIVESLPYDRSRTTMKRFDMCEPCRREFEDPNHRRYHAQPNACPECGPRLELWDPGGNLLADRHEALQQAAASICRGDVVAVKGLGGFHLMVDGENEEAVQRLRRRKHREEKPFALMATSTDWIQSVCEMSPLEERLLSSGESPIVVLHRRSLTRNKGVAPAVAPGNPFLGVMLPYTPLHHILIKQTGRPLVATSGNFADETLCIDEREALERLDGIADFFLVHNRPIARHVDDSIARVILGREQILRRARGYAPMPLAHREPLPPLLAVGPHLKNTVALSVGQNIFISQHIGDLESVHSYETLRRVTNDLPRLFNSRPGRVACDAHPGYLSTRHAKTGPLPCVEVQHHFAHVLSCMLDNDLTGPVLGIAWDGSGYGPDGTLWGGEFLLVPETGSPSKQSPGFTRFAQFRSFRLPGGERAVREPRRAALGLLYEMMGEEVFSRDDLPPVSSFSPEERSVLKRMLEKNIHSPVTSSVGRLFDAVAAIAGLHQTTRFEGQAAMSLEFALQSGPADSAYPLAVGEAPKRNGTSASPTWIVDWEPMIREMLSDVARGVSPGRLSQNFHQALIEVIVNLARKSGQNTIVLTGGCFQNRWLTEQAVQRLEEEGLQPRWHQRIPSNDGGIAPGQILAAALLDPS